MDFLSANWLRSMALPLRQSHPKIYVALNGIRMRLLAGRTGLDAYQARAVRRFRQQCWRVPRAARILEVGSDHQLAVTRALGRLGAAVVMGVNFERARAQVEGQPGSAALCGLQADARALPFPDECFDYVFSVATFEHIMDLPRALLEMHRVLRPGGELYSNFGPIWSAGKGHHVGAEVGSQRIHHARPEANPLPDHIHLLLHKDELAELLRHRISAEMIGPVVHSVFEAGRINRYFYHEYLAMFQSSPFEIRALSGEEDPVSPQLRRILEFRFPAERHFEVTNIEVVLRKSGNSRSRDS